MKKISIVLWVILLVTGCSVSDNKNPNKKTTQDPIEKANDVVIVSDVDSTTEITPSDSVDVNITDDSENTEQDLTDQTRSDTSEETKQSTETETIQKPTLPKIKVDFSKQFTAKFEDKREYSFGSTASSYFGIIPLRYLPKENIYVYERNLIRQDAVKDRVSSNDGYFDTTPYNVHWIPKNGTKTITFNRGITHIAIFQWKGKGTLGETNTPMYMWSLVDENNLKKQKSFIIEGTWSNPVITIK